MSRDEDIRAEERAQALGAVIGQLRTGQRPQWSALRRSLLQAGGSSVDFADLLAPLLLDYVPTSSLPMLSIDSFQEAGQVIRGALDFSRARDAQHATQVAQHLIPYLRPAELERLHYYWASLALEVWRSHNGPGLHLVHELIAGFARKGVHSQEDSEEWLDDWMAACDGLEESEPGSWQEECEFLIESASRLPFLFDIQDTRVSALNVISSGVQHCGNAEHQIELLGAALRYRQSFALPHWASNSCNEDA